MALLLSHKAVKAVLETRTVGHVKRRQKIYKFLGIEASPVNL